MHAFLRFPVPLATMLSLVLLAGPVQGQWGEAALSWRFDPSVLVADGHEIVRRAPPEAVDDLLQAITASAREPAEAEAVCSLFDPAGDRSLAGLNEVAARLPPQSRERLAGAVAGLFVAALQAPPQPYDKDAARRALKQAGVRATLMQDGFMAGLQGDHHPARCRSVRTLLDVLVERPREERVGVARLLLVEGLDRLHLLATAP